MKNWKNAVAALLLTACVVCWPAPAAVGQEMTPAQTDSLVWYAEQLEHDLAICKIGARADMDSLRVDLLVANMKIEYLQENQRKWYQSPILWYSIGVGVGVLASK